MMGDSPHNDLFDFFWLYTVSPDMFNIVVVPLRLQRPKSHCVKLAQQAVGFERLNSRRRIHRKGKSVVSYLATVT
jgi:hypothetical protein